MWGILLFCVLHVLLYFSKFTSLIDCLWSKGLSWFWPKIIWASSMSLGGKVQNSFPLYIFFREKNWIFFYTPRMLWPEGVSSFRPLLYGQVQCPWKEKCISVSGPYLFKENNANIILHKKKCIWLEGVSWFCFEIKVIKKSILMYFVSTLYLFKEETLVVLT